MIEFELLLRGGQIQISNVKNGSQITKASCFFSVDNFVMTEFRVEEGQTEAWIDMGDHLGSLEVVRIFGKLVCRATSNHLIHDRKHLSARSDDSGSNLEETTTSSERLENSTQEQEMSIGFRWLR